MSQAAPRHSPGATRPTPKSPAAVHAARAVAFHLLPPGISARADWKGCAEPGFNASPRQQALLDVVDDVFADAARDPNAIALEVAARLGCTHEDILRSRSNVDADGETGFFYEDFLYAVFTLRAQEAARAFDGLMDRLMQPAASGVSRRAPRASGA